MNTEHSTPGSAAIHQLDLRRGPLEISVEGAGRPLVLIPSLGRGQEDFDAIAPALLTARLQLVRPEPRGIGASAPLAEGATLHDMAADIGEAMDALGIGPALVAGHAAGNWVARMLAHDRPDLVRGVAMLAAVTGTTTEPEITRSISASFDTSLPAEERLVHLQRAYFAPGHDARAWLAGWHTDVARAQRAARAATTDRTWLRAADTRPLLYLAAAQDAIAPPPSEAEVVAALGPMARCVVVEGAGHALLPEQPKAVADALIIFAGDVWN
jgi:pimeloyl-ACP methyl ester carboxylesterase